MSRLSLSKYLKNRLKIYIYWLFRCCLTFTVLRWKKLIKRTWANLKTVMFTNRLLNIYIFPCVNELLNKSSIKYYITPAEKKTKNKTTAEQWTFPDITIIFILRQLGYLNLQYCFVTWQYIRNIDRLCRQTHCA